MVYIKDAKNLQKLWSQFKILCARTGTCSKFQTGDPHALDGDPHALDGDPHALDAFVQNYDTTATWRKVFVHSWLIPRTFSLFVYLYSPYRDRSAVQKMIAPNGMMIV